MPKCVFFVLESSNFVRTVCERIFDAYVLWPLTKSYSKLVYCPDYCTSNKLPICGECWFSSVTTFQNNFFLTNEILNIWLFSLHFALFWVLKKWLLWQTPSNQLTFTLIRLLLAMKWHGRTTRLISISRKLAKVIFVKT